MKLGLVARADDRGIGSMTSEFYRAMTPARTLVVREPGAEHKGFPAHVDRYPDAQVVIFDPKRGELSERACREFLDGLDVVYLVETHYDERFYQWARDARVTTVLHVMPEFWRWDASSPRPDVWWLPTSWRADVLPAECRVVEVPVPLSPPSSKTPHDAVTFVHVAGHRALADRNGTIQIVRACRFMRQQCVVRVITQDRNLPAVRATNGVELQTVTGGLADRWELYADVDALVLPRRYGGLCLPVLEAMACGVAVVMSDCEPQRSTWPIVPVDAPLHRSIEMPCGNVRLNEADPVKLARALDDLVAQPESLRQHAERSASFAREHSWSALRSTYEAEFELALSPVA